MTAARIFKQIGLGMLALGLGLTLIYSLLATVGDVNEEDISFLLLLVVIFLVNAAVWLVISFGLSQSIRRRESRQRHIDQNGVFAEGTITRLAPNRTVRVNRQYPYTYVEFTFQDGTGETRTSRDSFSTEAINRMNLQVGSHVTVKYLEDHPRRSTIVELLE
ncbi:MAG: DUF3592 domain-containing protein [Anaerolineae bacterium]|nr:MAG: DUF3592 domain-containing protein [Anaerolineae bacterium]